MVVGEIKYAANKGFCASWADGSTIVFWYFAILQFQLDKTLFGFCT